FLFFNGFNLNDYTDDTLYERFRLGRADIGFTVNLLQPQLEHTTTRSYALTVEEQVLMVLRFYACGSSYQVIGDGVCVCAQVNYQPSALASLVNQFVKFPRDPEETRQIKRKYFEMGRTPNTIGVIHSTHIHIQAPHEREREFVNRKGWHSINCVVKWSGSVYDNPPDGITLGDSAYHNNAEDRFNSRHFTSCNIILACIVLHNIAEKHKVPHCDGWPQEDGPDLPLAPLQPDGTAGCALREAFVNHYFTYGPVIYRSVYQYNISMLEEKFYV
uniref:DDE Tnp4 domain-containing protein n=1 Tax=Seriola dumerili TaxID=41447 RepID=A0A3B4TVL4_SERDU